MKRVVLTGCVLFAATAINFGDALYWVVGNRANQRCDIVTSNPVIFGVGYNAGYWFGDSPYRSRSDARLARSTIGACPKLNSDDEK
jgi:hypothetical protein